MKNWRPKSVLLAGPGSDDSFTENIAFTLSQMGVAVVRQASLTQQRYNSRWRAVVRELNERLRRDYRSPVERWLVSAAKATRPELFLAPTQCVSEETLRALKSAGVRARVAWWGDPTANMKRQGLLSDQWDAIFMKDADTASRFRRVGLNAKVLHEAMNPAWHRPVAAQANESVVVAGNFYEYRQFLVRRLISRGVKVSLYGGRLPLWVHPDIRERHSGRYIVREEKSRVFGEGLACLNSMQLIEGDSLNCRAFEIAGAGGLQLMEYRPAIDECFEPGKEILTFSSLDELIDHIERAMRDKERMRGIREAGARRALSEHTYRHRLERIFGEVAQL